MKLTQTLETEYEKVEETKIDTPLIIPQSKSLEKLITVWKEWTEKMANTSHITSSYFLYEKAYDQIRDKKIEYTQEDITNLCGRLIVLQEEDPIPKRKKYLPGPSTSFGDAFGIFMSALVTKHAISVKREIKKQIKQKEKREETEQKKQTNKREKTEYIIHTNNPYEPINYIGFHNIGNIIIDGIVGDYAGLAMRFGTLRILGNCGKEVGFFMRGGTIILEKEYQGIADSIFCGKIVHKENIIVQNSFNKKRRYI